MQIINDENLIKENLTESDWVYCAKPSDFTGVNKHFINLISADVFKNEKKSLFNFAKFLKFFK